MKYFLYTYKMLNELELFDKYVYILFKIKNNFRPCLIIY